MAADAYNNDWVKPSKKFNTLISCPTPILFYLNRYNAQLWAMFSATEKKLVWYTALFITVVFNGSKLMALRPGALIAQYWHFNGHELFCQAVLNLAVCITAAYINIHYVHYDKKPLKGIAWVVAANIALLVAGFFAGMLVQVRLFGDDTPLTIFRGAYILRLVASQALMGILLKILLLLKENNRKGKENEQLRNAYLNAQLQLLKEELNPHFFFNALSSLSSIVREDPQKAQQYISHLSKMFRYSLNKQEKSLVTLKDELTMLESYLALQQMRLEDGLIVHINIPQQYYNSKLPYMSLQPLLENAVKHNTASVNNPLVATIFLEVNALVVENNLQPLRLPAEGNGTGLANLNERYRIMTQKEIVIEKTTTKFVVKLPLQA